MMTVRCGVLLKGVIVVGVVASGSSALAATSYVTSVTANAAQTELMITGGNFCAPYEVYFPAIGGGPLPAISSSATQVKVGHPVGAQGSYLFAVKCGPDFTYYVASLDPESLGPTLAANTFTGPQTAPAFVGDGSGLTNLPMPAGAATLGTNMFTGAQTAPAFIGSGAGLTNLPLPVGAASLGANTFVGTQTIHSGNLELDASTVGAGNINKGGTAFLHSAGTANTFLGENAGNFILTGIRNAAVGTLALASNTSASSGAAFGYQALQNNTTGGNNTAIGSFTLVNNTVGNINTALGSFALFSNTTGFQNVATGTNALASNTTGIKNTASGGNALGLNTTGSNNTGIGIAALDRNTTGSGNTAVGNLAGLTSTVANGNISGSNNTYVGSNAGPGTPTQLNNATAIGANAVVMTSNAMVLGDGTVRVGIGSSAPSEMLDVVGNARISGALTIGGGASLANSSHILQDGASPLTISLPSGTTIAGWDCISLGGVAPGATTSMVVEMSPVGDPAVSGLTKLIWKAYVDAPDHVAGEFCKLGAGTDVSSASQDFNIRVIR